MPSISFKNTGALRKLSVGDTFDGKSNMGGSFTYTVQRRKNDGLVLSSNSDASWDKNKHYTWQEMKDAFYVSASTPIVRASQAQLEAVVKAGYDLFDDDIAPLLGSSRQDINRGLTELKTVYSALLPGGEMALLENKHDAAFISRASGIPPTKKDITMSEFFIGRHAEGEDSPKVYSSIAEGFIQIRAAQVREDWGETSNKDALVNDLRDALAPEITITAKELKDIKENIKTLPLEEAFLVSINKKKVSAPLRAQEVLNDPASFVPEDGLSPSPNDKKIHLLVNGEEKEFIHQPVHNQLFVLYNEELGISHPDLTADLKSVVEPALANAKRQPKQKQDADVEPAMAPKR